MRKTLILASLLIIALSCGRRGGSGQQAVRTRSFPRVEVPAMITDPSEQLVYILDHYWDGFFAGDWPTDSAVVLGVPSSEVNDHISLYVALLDKLPVPEAQARLKSAFFEDSGSPAEGYFFAFLSPFHRIVGILPVRPQFSSQERGSVSPVRRRDGRLRVHPSRQARRLPLRT